MVTDLPKLSRRNYEFLPYFFNLSGVIILPQLGCLHDCPQILNNRLNFFVLVLVSFYYFSLVKQRVSFCRFRSFFGVVIFPSAISLILALFYLFFLNSFSRTPMLSLVFLSVFHLHHIPSAPLHSYLFFLLTESVFKVYLI